MDKAQTRYALEYRGVQPANLEFDNAEEYEGVLRELLDVALLGNDVGWAKALHRSIQYVARKYN